MNWYTETFGNVSELLSSFISSSHIDASKLGIFDEVIEKSREDQMIVINHSYLSIGHQRVLFSALYNISQSMDVMKKRMVYAHKISENPSTAELSLELIPHLENVSTYIDQYLNDNKIPDEDKLFTFSRNLYKKSKKLGFTKDASSQLKEVGITVSEIESFSDSFTENVYNEIEIDEEEDYLDEDFC